MGQVLEFNPPSPYMGMGTIEGFKKAEVVSVAFLRRLL